MPREIISLDDLTVNNVGVFKKINSVTLPTTYPEQWYKDSLTDQLVKIAFYAELPVGAIKARAINFSAKQSYEAISSSPSASSSATASSDTTPKILPNAVYIESLAVLKEYQGLGIGGKLLDFIIEETKRRYIHEVVLHVSTENSKAIDWYLKKGFTKKEEVKDYYKEQGLSQPDAIILSLSV